MFKNIFEALPKQTTKRENAATRFKTAGYALCKIVVVISLRRSYRLFTIV